ncbi:MAG: uracil phosphoribosyltransferase [Flavobacteriales bacterium]|nr:uracil phosphoribosyltransferase [Flavobacteriales bacterium]
MLRDLSLERSVCNHFIAEIRDVDVQKDPLRFRRNLERIGEVMGYEISKLMDYDPQNVTTPLGKIDQMLMKNQPVIVSILRAGLTIHQGMLNYFDRAENAFVSAYRKPHGNSDEIEVEVEYIACPDLEGKELILCDPMLATGTSLILAYEALIERGTPSKVHVACAIASNVGIRTIQKHLPDNTTIHCGAIDPELNDMSYIVPGLGDAGDLAYGAKQ